MAVTSLTPLKDCVQDAEVVKFPQKYDQQKPSIPGTGTVTDTEFQVIHRAPCMVVIVGQQMVFHYCAGDTHIDIPHNRSLLMTSPPNRLKGMSTLLYTSPHISMLPKANFPSGRTKMPPQLSASLLPSASPLPQPLMSHLPQ